MTDDLRADAIKPQQIHADRPAHELRIDWADGHQSVFGFSSLRWLCPCAFCRGEAGQPGWLDSNPTLSDEQVTLSDISLVGHYAVQPVWADGHSSGFYSFEHLRRNCPCPAHGDGAAARRVDAAVVPPPTEAEAEAEQSPPHEHTHG
ncbi:MAG TPA: DUF971 domain-containing protein [Anaerolineae bacterium]|nr:DUF971 domain-containing protein [Anaerolineae bacterium]